MQQRLVSGWVLFASALTLASCGGGGHSGLPAANDAPLSSAYATTHAREHQGAPILPSRALSSYGQRLPNGYGPSDLQSAYGLRDASAVNGGGRVIALIESGDAPSLNYDLNVYRSTYGLPSCTQASGCLRKINQSGGSSLPRYDRNWNVETWIDAEIVSAICPKCSILVVEANSESIQDLAAAVNEAARQPGVFAISNSYGVPEIGHGALASAYSHPGIVITAGSGDSGFQFGPEIPAAFSTVVAVGGTKLTRAYNARGWAESVWYSSGNGADGSGCSAVVMKPAWQHDGGCAGRTIADAAFVADPDNSPVAIYYAITDPEGNAGWQEWGGTSVGTPAIAAIYALAGNRASDASSLYANATYLHDVNDESTNGATNWNGSCQQPSWQSFTNVATSFSSSRKREPSSSQGLAAYLCTAVNGYDGPTGNGTPNGPTAFKPVSTPAPTPTPTATPTPKVTATPTPFPTGSSCPVPSSSPATPTPNPSPTPTVHPTQNPSSNPCTS